MSDFSLDNKWTPDPITALAGANSSPIYIPGNIGSLVATVIPGGGGTATLYHTTAQKSLVEANPNNVQWIAWEAGAVGAATSRAAIGPVTAIRIAATVATATLQVTGQRIART